jgi:hypothetical protein
MLNAYKYQIPTWILNWKGLGSRQWRSRSGMAGIQKIRPVAGGVAFTDMGARSCTRNLRHLSSLEMDRWKMGTGMELYKKEGKEMSVFRPILFICF